MNYQVIILVEAAGAASSTLQYPTLENTNHEQALLLSLIDNVILIILIYYHHHYLNDDYHYPKQPTISLFLPSSHRGPSWLWRPWPWSVASTISWKWSCCAWQCCSAIVKSVKYININQVSYLLGSMAEHQQNIGLYGSFTTLSAVLGWVEQIQRTKT